MRRDVSSIRAARSEASRAFAFRGSISSIRASASASAASSRSPVRTSAASRRAALAVDGEHVPDVARFLADGEDGGAADGGLPEEEDGKFLVGDMNVEILDLGDGAQGRHPFGHRSPPGLEARPALVDDCAVRLVQGPDVDGRTAAAGA